MPGPPPSSVDGSGNPLHPIFTYTVADATTANPLLLTAAMINNPSGVISGSQPLNTCTGTTGLLCPLDDIQSVTIHLRVQRPATNSSGGVMGKMISPQNIAVGVTTVGLVGHEGDVARSTIAYSLFLALLLSLIALAQAYWLTWMVP